MHVKPFLFEQKPSRVRMYTSIQVYNPCAKSVVHICTKEVECFLFVFDLFHVTFFGHSEGRMREMGYYEGENQNLSLKY